MTAWIIRSFVTAMLAVGILDVNGCDKPTTAPTTARGSVDLGIPQSLPTVPMTIANRQFTIEMALDEDTRTIGLMHRDSMPSDRGMIFAFAVEEELGFWMRNTRIPLDIIYMNKDGKIVSIRTMLPMDLTSIKSGQPAKYALELNRGMATALGLKVGDTIPIPPSVVAKK